MFKWTPGHDSYSYLVTIHEKDYAWLQHADFQVFVDDYLAQTPPGNNTAMTPSDMRYHADSASFSLAKAADPLFEPNQTSSVMNASFLYHPWAKLETNTLYKYSDVILSNDVRTSYFNPTYPWIEQGT